MVDKAEDNKSCDSSCTFRCQGRKIKGLLEIGGDSIISNQKRQVEHHLLLILGNAQF
jgi:hypothetical protein